MPSIKELRQAGKLEEAKAMVDAMLAEHPDSLDAKRQLGWVHFSYLKRAVEQGDFGMFMEHINDILGIGLPLEDEKLLGNQIGWQIHGITKNMNPQQQHPFIIQLLEKSRYFTFDRESDPVPSILMLRLALKVRDKYFQVLNFMDEWDLEKMPPKEYESFIPEGGKPIMSLAERSHIAYAHALLDYHYKNPGLAVPKIEAYLPKQLSIMESYPGYKYIPYFRGKLLIAIGRSEEALNDIKTFVKKQVRQYWAWTALAEIYRDMEEKTKAKACFAKAIQLEKDENFLLKVRQQFAQLLLEEGDTSAAKREIQTVLDTRGKHEYKVPQSLQQLQLASWFKEAPLISSNKEMYKEWAPQAVELLYEDVPVQIGLISGINKEAERVYFLVNKNIKGFFKTHKPNSWKIGQAVAVRLEAKEGTRGTFYEVLTWNQTKEKPSPKIFRAFQGQLSIPEGKNFGFVRGDGPDVFVPAFVLKKIENQDTVHGEAMLSFDKKKDRWGWQAVSVILDGIGFGKSEY